MKELAKIGGIKNELITPKNHILVMGMRSH